jgi:hypothetical protein
MFGIYHLKLQETTEIPVYNFEVENDNSIS